MYLWEEDYLDCLVYLMNETCKTNGKTMQPFTFLYSADITVEISQSSVRA